MPASAHIDIPYADARASELRWLLGLEPLTALKSLTARAAAFSCELRIIGCSHQVLVDDGALLSETVACLPGRGAPASALPQRFETQVGGLRYRISSAVGRLSERTPAQLDALVAAHVADPRGLAGVFPGHPHAFTALALREHAGDGGRGGVAWETLHAYPQSDEIVHTHSTLEPLTR